MTGAETRDRRSVGELLADSDAMARRLLRDADDADPRAVIRSWGETVESTAQLWAALPHPGPGLQVPHEGTMRQVQSMNARLVHRTWSGAWPGPGGEDPRLAEMTSNFDRAAELIRRHHRRDEGGRLSDAGSADVHASRVRLMHSLYLASHAVGITLGREVRAFEDPEQARARRHEPQTVHDFQSRVTGVEQMLGSVIASQWPTALTGEHRPEVDSSRLAQSWAGWDLQAQRSLAHAPTTATMAVVAATQAAALRGGSDLVKTASLLERIDPLEYRHRLEPTLETSTQQWTDAARAWQQLAARGTREVDPDLVHAARELRAAITEVTADRAVHASPETIAARVDVAEITRTVQRAVIASADLAQAAHDTTLHPGMSAPARSVQQATVLVAERQRTDRVEVSPEVAWVSPNDLRRNAAVPLPQILQDDLAQRMHSVADAAGIARDATTPLERATTQPPTIDGRVADDQKIGRPRRVGPEGLTP